MFLKRKVKKMLFFFTSKVNQILLKVHKVSYGKTLKVNGVVKIVGKGRVCLGDNVKINSSLKSNPIGGDTKTIIRTIDKGEIIIGNNTGISNSTIVSAKKVIIGNDVLIGGSCRIYDLDFHSLDYFERIKNDDKAVLKEEIVISDGVFIGAHTIILKGIKIGEKSVIGAGSVVSKSIPANEVWGGNPIKFIRKI